jgi:phosphomannomutase
MDKIIFGTDGWRGKIAENYTFDSVRRCAQGFASYLKQTRNKKLSVVIGFDKRFQSENFALAAGEVMAGNGIHVFLTNGPTPTPVISYSVVDKKADGAVNITASHNPFSDDGFKVRDEHGGAIAPDGLKQIEKDIPDMMDNVKSISSDIAISSGEIEYFDPVPAYSIHIDTLIDRKPLIEAGINILVDAMWGNGAGWYPHFLSGGKTKVEEIHNQRNPIFPEMQRPEPIPPNIDIGLRTTINLHKDVLIINDGDADRIGIGDERGIFINQLQVFAILAYYCLEIRGERGPIVKTLSTTSMLDILGKIYNVPVYETGVGFKYVAPKMLETNAMIGGEESGGYAFRGNVPERDGILAGLYFLDFMVKTKKTPSELLALLFEKVGAHYYDRMDRNFSGDRKERERLITSENPKMIGGLKVTGLNSLDGYKFGLEDGGWLLIRFSGTEPIMRVYCETTHQDKVQAILQDGLRIAGLS